MQSTIRNCPSEARRECAWPRRTPPMRSSSSCGTSGGLTVEESATVLGISPATADCHLTFARAWQEDGATAADSLFPIS